MTDTSTFPDPTYRDTVLSPLFEGVKAHYATGMDQINRAHLVMLCETGILNASDAAQIARTLTGISAINLSDLTYTGEHEDYFFWIEAQLRDRLGDLEADGWKVAMAPALARATEIAAKGVVWGDIHKLEVGHVFSRAPLSLIANRYLLDTISVPGSKQTIFKTSHNYSDEEHRAFFGAQARHVSDMGDPDANWFILFGGQDGWIGSPAFADQVPLWRKGELIQMPLRPESVSTQFPTVTRLMPQ